jgi:Transglutaminase-like superfamily
MLSIPDHVHMTTGPRGGTVLLDQRTGRCYAMNGIARQLWQAWHDTGDFDTALSVVAGRDPVDDRFRAESRKLAESLLAKGLLVTESRTGATRDDRVPHGEPDAASPNFRLAAALAVPLTFLLVLLPFRVTVRLLTWSRRHWCRRGAATNQALAAMTATRMAARYHPGRVACLEVSLGTVITLALRRRYAALVIGVADDPCRFHAWVNAHEGPVHDPHGWRPGFRPIITL